MSTVSTLIAREAEMGLLYIASGHHRIMGGQQLRALVTMVLGKEFLGEITLDTHIGIGSSVEKESREGWAG